MVQDHILAIDAGTQSIRALVFDTSGNPVAKSQVFIEPYVSPAPGLAEQDPLVYWNALCEACPTPSPISRPKLKLTGSVSISLKSGTKQKNIYFFQGT